MELLLIRHGSTLPVNEGCFDATGCPDPALDAAGQSQAAKLADKLAGAGVEKIYASGMRRALQTAGILSCALKVPMEMRPGLQEIHMGRLHRESWEQIRQAAPRIYSLWHAHETDEPYPGGERGEDAALRVMPVLLSIARSHEGRAGAVVHGGVIRVWCVPYSGCPNSADSCWERRRTPRSPHCGLMRWLGGLS